ncbi:Acyl carrier protein phosphodiesterase [Ekhidna lutea]|uniref:Acyl carrier protein phosphodiesterase n=1 Tax=Ekhidna lutea TaxID=447679 RepID=A0A239JFL2_EKHLU|nr:ACP phosphodiesterase [Ekhidna lutea]SNT04701.1 Acyl carrier protein phosphodiesterase [Ekhidna lutea]
MNFLAHLYLSGADKELLVGNFIGDFVKGSQMDEYTDGIQKGIRLHRAIDFYTDNHDTVLQSKIRLREKFRHYAPVIVDVFYDHFLARDWGQFSDTPLKEYTESFYETMSDYHETVPKGVVHMLSFMAQDNWLYNYQFIEGIDRALTGMSRRTKYENKMDEASKALKNHYEDFEKEFHQFFPELEEFVANFEK